ncbi:MAG: DUF4190 domain-containing protein [Candidatus Dormiibacterota bacterium]
MADDPPAPPPAQSGPVPGLPPQANPYGYAPQQTIIYGRQGNGIGVAAGVCGIVAVAVCWIPFVDYVSIILGALAIVFGVIGVRTANRSGGAGKGMAVTGIVCGIAGLAIAIIFLLLIYALVSSVTFVTP